jgi:hypothetical protein
MEGRGWRLSVELTGLCSAPVQLWAVERTGWLVTFDMTMVSLPADARTRWPLPPEMHFRRRPLLGLDPQGGTKRHILKTLAIGACKFREQKVRAQSNYLSKSPFELVRLASKESRLVW